MMKENRLVILLSAVAISLLSALIGASSALYLARVVKRSDTISSVRTQNLEIVDKDGKVRAALGFDEKGTHFQMMSSQGLPILSMSVLEKTAEGQNLINAVGPRALQYPHGEFSINDKTGWPVISIANPAADRGQINLGTAQFNGKLTLGYFPTNDSYDDQHEYGAWGLRVMGMRNGKHVGTGVGILNADGVDRGFIAPEPVSEPGVSTKGHR
jgi:hypothetical protein